MSDLGYHQGYRYAHDYPNAYAAGECFLPEELHGRRYYEPSERGYEQRLRQMEQYFQQCDALAPPSEQRYSPEHARAKMAELKRYAPDLFSDDVGCNPSHN